MRAWRWILAVLVVVLAPVGGSGAQEVYLENRLIDLPSNVTLEKGVFQLLFTHRFSQAVDDAGGSNLFGLDSAADIGIGLEYGLTEGLEVEVYRSSYFKQLEGAVKWSAVTQGSWPLSIALRAGADYRGARGVDERWSGFLQVIAGRRLGSVDLALVPMYASDTPTLTNAFNVGVGAALHLPRYWDLMVEVIPENRDAPGAETAWSVGIVKRVTGHQFLVYLGNSRATTVDLLVGSDFPGGFALGDVRLGFNLLRRFPE